MGADSSTIYRPSEAKAAEIDNIALDTNILVLPFSIILQQNWYHNCLPHFCRGCGAAFNIMSNLHSRPSYLQKMAEEPGSDEQNAKEDTEDIQYIKGKFIKNIKSNEDVWICEFCDVHNKIPKDTVLPQAENELYLIKRHKKGIDYEQLGEGDSGKLDETSLVFCIDTSGSMNTNYNVLKDGQYEQVTRMNLMASAILNYLRGIKEANPYKKIGIVLFGSGVKVIGDLTHPEIKLTKNLDDFDKIFNNLLNKNDQMILRPIKETFYNLEKAINNLEARGGTALGPGLLSSLALAKQGKASSQIIVCTDGLANIGIGSLQNSGDLTYPKAFYKKVGDIAIENKISRSVITVKGEICQVETLGSLADRTGGQIISVDPANFDLANLDANSLIATNVKLKAIIHEGLSFKNEISSDLHNNNSILKKEIGVISKHTENYFEYCVKKVENLQEEGINLENLDSLPLQAQISYTDLEGNEFLLVASRRQKLTKDQEEVKKDMDLNVLSEYVQKFSAGLALDGKFDEAKKNNEDWINAVEKMEGKDQELLKKFKVQNQQLQELLERSQNKQEKAEEIDREEATSKLYEIKQKKSTIWKHFNS